MFDIRQLDGQMTAAVADFFSTLRDAGDEPYFHPHPLTQDEAVRRTGYRGADIYYVIIEDGVILGYGFLRGWDDGYEVPSLGIAIHPRYRRGGLGRMLMHVLHEAARRRGARQVLLTVEPANTSARSLYEDLGYAFEHVDGRLVGVLDLERNSPVRERRP